MELTEHFGLRVPHPTDEIDRAVNLAANLDDIDTQLSWVDGDIYTRPASVASHIWTADESRVDTTTPTLSASFPILADKIYTFRAMLIVKADSDTPGIKLQFESLSNYFSWSILGRHVSEVYWAQRRTSVMDVGTSTAIRSFGVHHTVDGSYYNGELIYATGYVRQQSASGAYTFDLKWSQNTASPSATYIREGSFILLEGVNT